MSARRRPMAVPSWWLADVAARRRERREFVWGLIYLLLLFVLVAAGLPLLADALPVYGR